MLFGLPDQEAGTVRYAVEIPKLSSLVLKHSLDAPLAGLDSLPRAEWPPVPIVFWSFRIMVGLGMLMLLLGCLSLLARWRGRLYAWRPLHRFAVAMGPAGFVAVLAGWITTEVGRQPYTVYGLLRTAQSASPLHAPAVAASLTAFVVIYFSVFAHGHHLHPAPHGQAPAGRRARHRARYADPDGGHHARPIGRPGPPPPAGRVRQPWPTASISQWSGRS